MRWGHTGDKLTGCTSTAGYACYSQYGQSQIPNIYSLASAYAVSDRTFENATIPSWGSHLSLVAATLDGYSILPGSNPAVGASGGNSCDSTSVVAWNGGGGPPPGSWVAFRIRPVRAQPRP